MRHALLVLYSSSIFVASLVLSGCNSSMMSSSNNPMPGSGPAPVVAAVGEQVNGVAPNRKQEVQFSEAMDPSTINAQSFKVADASGKLAQGMVSYDPDYNTASFLPSPSLQAGATYTATITTAATSSGGVPLASPYTYTFTTRDTTDTSPLSVDSVSPAANATCVSPTTAITITFNEAPDASTVTAGNIVVTGPGGAIATKISLNVTTTQVVLTPTSALPSGNISVTVSNIADLAGVTMAAPYTWTFSTACSGGGGGGATSGTFVYVGNSVNIAGFSIAADGSATGIPGSPFALAGEWLAAAPNGNFLYSDGQTGPHTGMAYYTYLVAANGSLSTASSTNNVSLDPMPPNTAMPPTELGWITTDRTGATLYGEQFTAPAGEGDQWVGEYAIGTNGSLSLIGPVAAENENSSLSFTSDNRYAYYLIPGLRQGPSSIRYVTRNSDGTLTANGRLDLAPPAGMPLGAYPGTPIASPNSNNLAVILAQNSFGGGGSAVGIAVYSINNDGTLGAPTPFLPLAGAWSSVWDSSGKYLFVDFGGSIYEIRFDSSSNTLALTGTPVATSSTVGYDERMFFLNGHLFVADANAQRLHVFNFENGVLTPAPGSPISIPFSVKNNVAIAALQH